jgi:CHAT domain-containing protein
LPALSRLQSAAGTASGTDPGEVKLTAEQLEELVVGDEVVGLARAFLSSGAQSVLGTLWQANPKAVKALLVSMCTHHQTGLTWAQALCAAQRELIAGIYSDMWLWAPYQLIGRWR